MSIIFYLANYFFFLLFFCFADRDDFLSWELILAITQHNRTDIHLQFDIDNVDELRNAYQKKFNVSSILSSVSEMNLIFINQSVISLTPSRNFICLILFWDDTQQHKVAYFATEPLHFIYFNGFFIG